ncbi:MAG: hypothetical protein QE271_04320 [Bacteriovoracaceae bacterium]|nr:hypothetical protein [Bacteriovoracaceae bacterium]
MKNFFHKLYHFEYWPFWIFYLPVFLSWPIFSLRGRSLVFFTSSNPFIPLGGCIEESKDQILSQLPKENVARWIIIKFDPSNPALDFPPIKSWMSKENLTYPLIAKPDVGERGDFVKIIHSELEMMTYTNQLKRDFILQEFISHPFEAGIMAVRDPVTLKTKITSIVTKNFLSVVGDGKLTIEELASRIPRAIFQIPRLKEDGFDFDTIPSKGECVLIEPIGNHKRGTMFLNGKHLITDPLNQWIDSLFRSTPGLFFGRFDIKCLSESEMKLGRNIKILELNGAFSEPGHIYDPSENLLNAWKDLWCHWWTLASVSGKNKLLGHNGGSVRKFLSTWIQFLKRK